MATTGFWPVKGSLRDVVRYADNPDKTTNPKYLDKDLAAALKYVANDDKTDKELFVTGINCPSVRAYEQMMATKHRYGKTGGNVAYHGYQSFKSGEVTPEEAHEIGIETAKRMWGKDFEIVVTTHLNTENLHNHIVINSVSFKTGRKFENHIKDHIKLREISDDVCREHEKSVIENAKFYKSDKKEYWIHKQGKLTHRDILRRDVDEAISKAATLGEFQRILINMGYIFERDFMYEHPSVLLRSWNKPIRIDSLGIDYTREAIRQRTENNLFIVNPYESKRRIRNAKPQHTLLKEIEYQSSRMRKMGALEAILYVVIELLKPMKGNKQNYQAPLSPSLRQELVKLELYQKQFRLMTDNDIHTEGELNTFIVEKKSKIIELEHDRSVIDNKRRRAKTDDELELYKQQKKEITAVIKPIREQLRLAESIMENIPKLESYLEAERILEKKVEKERAKKKEDLVL